MRLVRDPPDTSCRTAERVLHVQKRTMERAREQEEKKKIKEEGVREEQQAEGRLYVR